MPHCIFGLVRPASLALVTALALLLTRIFILLDHIRVDGAYATEIINSTSDLLYQTIKIGLTAFLVIQTENFPVAIFQPMPIISTSCCNHLQYIERKKNKLIFSS